MHVHNYGDAGTALLHTLCTKSLKESIHKLHHHSLLQEQLMQITYDIILYNWGLGFLCWACLAISVITSSADLEFFIWRFEMTNRPSWTSNHVD
jgi:hypothetical protein